MYFILFYKTVDNYIELRAEYREEHLQLGKEAENRGELILAGALSEPADKAVLVFKCDSIETVEKFAKSDPYVINGLIKTWEIRPWTVVIGN